MAVGQPGGRAEVDDAEPAVGQQPEVARVRVGVQQPGPLRGRRSAARPAGSPARSRCSRVPSAMIRDSGVPSSHSETITFGALATTRGTTICVVAGVGGGERPLRVGLQPVVQLLDDPGLELGDQRLDVHAGEQRGEQPREPGELVEVGHQRGARARGTGS